MDNFYEQLISDGVSAKYKALKVINYIFAASAIMYLVFLVPILSAFFFVLAILSIYLRINSLIEYEYSFTNGEIDVDKIIEMKKRKSIAIFEAKDIEILASENNDELKHINMPKKVIKCTLGKNRSLYKVVVNSDKGRYVLIMSPDEEFIKLCRKYNPRAVKL